MKAPVKPALASVGPSGETAIRPPELTEINPPIGFWSGPARMWRNARENRHLLYNFIQRDIRLKYRDSALGYFWSLLEPLMMSAVYFILYVIIAGKPDPRYPLWVILGVITWSFFTKAVSDSLVCLTRNEGMIKQVYFPRELFALTSVGSALALTLLNLLVAIPLLLIYRIPPTPYLLMVPVGLLLTALLGLGIGMGMACLNVVNRDVDFFFRFLTRAGVFLAPVMWTVEMAPPSKAKWIDYLLLNPMAVPITMVRDGIAGERLGIGAGHVAYSVGFCLFSFLLGSMFFMRYEAFTIKKL